MPLPSSRPHRIELGEQVIEQRIVGDREMRGEGLAEPVEMLLGQEANRDDLLPVTV